MVRSLRPTSAWTTNAYGDGVVLAAIQGLNTRVEDTSQRSEIKIRKLEAENAELKRRLEALEKIIRNQRPN